MLNRPGPLRELPLDSFLLPPPSSGKPIKLTKRPHSPGGPTSFSPAKCRILSEEGILPTGMGSKSPFPRGKDAFASPARFSKVLAGPASPARVLDFGLPKNSGGDPQKRSVVYTSTARDASLGQTSSSGSALAPSPELKSRSIRAARTPDLTRESHTNVDSLGEVPSPSISRLILVPRELPPPTDPQSIHYPGFFIFQDPYTIVYASTSEGAPSVSSSDQMEVQNDDHKENLPPRRRKIRKVGTELTSSTKADVLSPAGSSLKKSNSTNETPRRTWNNGDQMMRSPFLTPNAHIYRGMRQLMKDELNIGEDQMGDY